jgi:hypothetical protein
MASDFMVIDIAELAISKPDRQEYLMLPGPRYFGESSWYSPLADKAE